MSFPHFSLVQDFTYEAGKNLIDDFIINIITKIEFEMFSTTEMFLSQAKIILGIMILFYLSVKALRLMTGDGQLTLIPLVRPFIFFLIVVSWSPFLTVLDAPLNQFESTAKATYNSKRDNVNKEFNLYTENKVKLVEHIYIQTEKFSQSWKPLGDIIYGPVSFGIADAVVAMQRKVALALFKLQIRIDQAISLLVVEAMTFFYRGVIYFLFFIQILLFTILRIIGPVIFALSIVPAYRDLYLQWISKYVSVALYVVFAYIAMMLSFVLITAILKIENAWLLDMIYKVDNKPSEVDIIDFLRALYSKRAAFGIFPIALVTGILGLLAVPVISTWVLGANSTSSVTNSTLQHIGSGTKAAAGGAAKIASSGVA